MNELKIKKASLNNLKDISLNIPKQQLTVVTGISGSGKSSLAFDLIFEEGKKRYFQSLGMSFELEEGSVEEIIGLGPTIAVKQSIIRQSNPRSTVGSKTGILSQLGILYANEGMNKSGEKIENVIDPGIFSYLSPSGMCFDCAGTGKTFKINLDKVIPNKSISLKCVFERIGSTTGYLNLLKRKYPDYYEKPFSEIPDELQDDLINGVMDQRTGKISYCIERVLHSRYQRIEDVSEYYSLHECSSCEGFRVGEEAREIYLNSYHIGQLGTLTLIELKDLLENWLDEKVTSFFEKMLLNILKTLQLLIEIKLGHLTLYREMPSLSGGELQRLFLHNHLEAKLSDLIYVFDEPTSGLHESEKNIIINSLFKLIEKGNTVIVVSHDKSIVEKGDHLIEVGPKAGNEGGEIVFQGPYSEYKKSENIRSTQSMNLPKRLLKEKNKKESIKLSQISDNNLKNISVDIPLEKIVGVVGVSGSGKSSLISNALVPLVKEKLKGRGTEKIQLNGELNQIIEIGQEPIGRKSNSNPATYLGVWDNIRKLYAKEEASRQLKLTAGDFSFNSKGACQACSGSGKETIILGMNLQFNKVCSSCKGKRFNEDTLSVYYQNKNIYELLEMSISEAIEFLSESGLSLTPLETINSIGMGYLKLGQPTSTLSGGEAQRLKLAKEIGKKVRGKTLYILDEPSTGLSYFDISKLIHLLIELVNLGHSVIVIEHELEVIKHCDWLIELGEGGGHNGGNVIATGVISELRENKKSITGRYL